MREHLPERPAIVVLGPPGSGKGTLARLLTRELGYLHVDVGALLRQRAETGDRVGERIAIAQARGLMVPTDLVVSALSSCVNELDAARTVVLDGFPRTTVQVAAIDDGRVPVRITAAFWLDVPVDVARARLVVRRATERRNDDSPGAVEQRMALVSETVDAVRALYEKRGILECVDASLPADAVFEQVASRLDLADARSLQAALTD